MGAEDTYDAICKAFEGDVRIRVLRAYLDELAFGNFIIAFQLNGQPKSIVNDRGQLFLHDNLSGAGAGTEVVRSLYNADEDTLLQTLAALLA